MAARKPKNPPRAPGGAVKIRFTGASGGSCYVLDGKVVLRKEETVQAPLEGHWAALVASGNAEVVGE